MASQKQLKQRLKALMALPENQVCSDCPERQPRWASLIVPPPGSPPGTLSIGAFCCLECSGSHRRLGVHISFVRSVNLDSWKEKEVLAMENGGNKKVNDIFEAHLTARKPQVGASGPTRERFIRDKYERRKFYDPNVLARYNSMDPSTQREEQNVTNGPVSNRERNPSEVARMRKQRKKPSYEQRASQPRASAPKAQPPAPAPAPAVDLLDLNFSEPAPAPAPTQAAPASANLDLFSANFDANSTATAPSSQTINSVPQQATTDVFAPQPAATNAFSPQPAAAPNDFSPQPAAATNDFMAFSNNTTVETNQAQPEPVPANNAATTAIEQPKPKSTTADIMSMYSAPMGVSNGMMNNTGAMNNTGTMGNGMENMMGMMQQMSMNPQQGSNMMMGNKMDPQMMMAYQQQLMMQQMMMAQAQGAGGMGNDFGMNPAMMMQGMPNTGTNGNAATNGGNAMMNGGMSMNNAAMNGGGLQNGNNNMSNGFSGPSMGSGPPISAQQNGGRAKQAAPSSPQKEDPFAQFGMNVFRS